MSKNPINRTAVDHIKEGFKNIPKVYKALYNQPKTDAKGAPGKGVGATIKDNVKYVVQGPMKNRVMTPQQKTADNKTRATVVGMGAASVTPVGPIAAFAVGVKKSIQAQNKAISNKPVKGTAQVGIMTPKGATTPPNSLKLKTPPKK